MNIRTAFFFGKKRSYRQASEGVVNEGQVPLDCVPRAKALGKIT